MQVRSNAPSSGSLTSMASLEPFYQSDLALPWLHCRLSRLFNLRSFNCISSLLSNFTNGTILKRKLPFISTRSMTTVLSRAPPSFPHTKPHESSIGQTMPRKKFFERALASSRAVSRDMLHTTRSLYRREHVNELMTTIEPPPDVVQVRSSGAHENDGATQALYGDDRGDLTLRLRSFIPDVIAPINEEEEYSDSMRRTRPLTPEANNERGSLQFDAHTIFPRPPSSLQRSLTQVNSPTSRRSEAVPELTEQPFHVQFRPPIPPRNDSLPQRRVFLNLVDQSNRHDTRVSRQSVTAYVSADYSETPVTPTMTMTSWLSDPDGPPDDLASWNRPVTAQPSHNENPDLLSPAAARPQLGPRSKTTPVYSTVTAPLELSDAAYERVLREKLRHHAGQVKKRVDTSTYYSPTVRQKEMEIHLAFVRAAEEILKKSPIWHGTPNDTMNMQYLLEA